MAALHITRRFWLAPRLHFSEEPPEEGGSSGGGGGDRQGKTYVMELVRTVPEWVIVGPISGSLASLIGWLIAHASINNEAFLPARIKCIWVGAVVGWFVWVLVEKLVNVSHKKDVGGASSRDEAEMTNAGGNSRESGLNYMHALVAMCLASSFCLLLWVASQKNPIDYYDFIIIFVGVVGVGLCIATGNSNWVVVGCIAGIAAGVIVWISSRVLNGEYPHALRFIAYFLFHPVTLISLAGPSILRANTDVFYKPSKPNSSRTINDRKDGHGAMEMKSETKKMLYYQGQFYTLLMAWFVMLVDVGRHISNCLQHQGLVDLTCKLKDDQLAVLILYFTLMVFVIGIYQFLSGYLSREEVVNFYTNPEAFVPPGKSPITLWRAAMVAGGAMLALWIILDRGTALGCG